MASSIIHTVTEIGKWDAHIYDYETYLRTVSNCEYRKIGDLYIARLSGFIDLSGIDTMLQIRNLPFNNCIGGTIYIADSQLPNRTAIYIQPSYQNAYVRENLTSAALANPNSVNVSFVFFGY